MHRSTPTVIGRDEHPSTAKCARGLTVTDFGPGGVAARAEHNRAPPSVGGDDRTAVIPPTPVYIHYMAF